jgi:hypothetical protein
VLEGGIFAGVTGPPITIDDANHAQQRFAMIAVSDSPTATSMLGHHPIQVAALRPDSSPLPCTPKHIPHHAPAKAGRRRQGAAACVRRHRYLVLIARLLIAENFLPKIDGVTRTLARLLDHLRDQRHEALIVGPDNGLVVIGFISPD